LWDRGSWQPDPQTPGIDAALKAGELKFSLEGLKLKGSWELVRTRRQPGKGPDQWLLIKHRDEWSGDIDVAAEAPQSVKSFGDLSDILAAHGMVDEWRTHPPVKGGETGKLLQQVIAAVTSGGVTKANRRRGKGVTDEWTTNPGGKADSGASVSPQESRRSSPLAKPLPAAAFKLGAHRPKLTNQAKILFPKTGFTKGDLVGYYTRVARHILPQLAGRAVSLKRFPDGVDGKSFFEKHCNQYRPDWVKTVRVHTGDGTGSPIDFCEIADLATLQWAANLAAIELHVPLALAAAPDTPTAMIFDLDPGEPATFKDCVRIGLRLKALLDELGLVSLPKTSGGKGLHVLIPLNTPGVTFDQTKAFARAVALTLERDDSKGVIASMSKAAREGKVFIDWSQNDRNKTNACVFSVRAREQPSISWPVSWDELHTIRLPVLATIDQVDSSAAKLLKILDRRQNLPK
ncbi:MAG: ligD 2, partial [Phycisphaerales bacterium]|nr:ligD 2 [Phycisphaerales bacterium]